MNEAVDQGLGFVTEAAPQPINEFASIPIMERRREAFRIAVERYSTNTDWLTYFREILGVDGVVNRMFTHTDDLRNFEASQEFREIQTMLMKLRDRPGAEATDKEPIRVITVRMPRSVHEYLKKEAEDRSTSINQLCITKLLKIIEDGEAQND